MKEQPLSHIICEFEVPLPSKLHQVVEESDIGRRRVLVIGDVHGCFDELQDLIQVHAICPEDTVLVFCGDIVNRGPKNREVICFIRDFGFTVYSVRGNHEDRVIHEWLNFHNRSNGHIYKLSPKYEWVVELSKEDVDFLLSLPYTLSIPCMETIVVHGGLDPWESLERQQPKNLVLTRNIVDPDQPSHKLTDSLDCGVPWISCWNGPEHVYFGHDATRSLQERRFGTGLDTGCVYGNRLTGALLTRENKSISRRIISVPARQAYKEKTAKVSHEDFFYDPS
jgi:hypothetical protein